MTDLHVYFEGAIEGEKPLVAALENAPTQYLGWLELDESAKRARLALHPGCEPIELSWRSGALCGAVHTATGGPGYHVAAIQWLEGLRSHGVFALRIDDPSGWLERRSDLELEERVRAALAQAGRRALVAARTLGKPVLFGMPRGFGVVELEAARIVTPLTMYRLSDWRALLGALENGDRPVLERAWPWWRPGLNAFMWRNVARAWLARAPEPSLSAEARRFRFALEAARRALALEPEIELPAALLAEAAEALDDLEEAALWFERALAREPGRHDLWPRWIGLLERSGRPLEAARALSSFARRRPRDRDLALQAATRLLDLERPQRALEALERALEHHPHDAGLHGERAVALARLGRLEEALAANARALELVPDHPVGLAHREALFSALGRLKGAS